MTVGELSPKRMARRSRIRATASSTPTRENSVKTRRSRPAVRHGGPAFVIYGHTLKPTVKPGPANTDPLGVRAAAYPILNPKRLTKLLTAFRTALPVRAGGTAHTGGACSIVPS